MAKERRPTLRQEQQAETRRRLLRAARDAFLTLGFTGTTIDRIVEDANTSRATFYLHFTNKTEALVATWQELELAEVDELFVDFDAAADFSEAAVHAWIGRLVEYWERHGQIGRTALQTLALQPELELPWVAGMVKVVDDMPRFRDALGGGELARAVVLANVVQLERALYFWSNDNLPIERSLLISALARNWMVSEPR